ncbi:hypothetical protein BC939DRAFT_451740 [Gamsiella multidivaricata]|uniref:uncharacterized protein n=1 Tax=Gamsiella multidivaricata TaxID=101098 RepID=UPI00221FF653|nr:uncharacterized protein BC939DRAFT_451740 [Gamsiella multidivaricata]KAI7823334.1 hypothetical protein BC939DRAFT_451740 [Gamsiella multidivaricata]
MFLCSKVSEKSRRDVTRALASLTSAYPEVSLDHRGRHLDVDCQWAYTSQVLQRGVNCQWAYTPLLF